MVVALDTDMQRATARNRGARRHEHRRPPRRSDKPTVDPNQPYPISDFLDDQRCIVIALDPQLAPARDRLSRVDGSMLLVRVALLRQSRRRWPGATKALRRKYGTKTDGTLMRLHLVLDFLDRWRDEIRRSGLSEEDEPMMVREEFVRHLLEHRVDPSEPYIPANALTRFLDEWGHRWL